MTYGAEERCTYTGFWCRNPKERDLLEDPGVDGRITLKKGYSGNGMGDVDWIVLAQDSDRWQAVVKGIT
jgi:hypothetical protein